MKLQYKFMSLALVLIQAACATAPVQPERVKGDNYQYAREYLEWMIDEKMVENKIVGLSIAIVDNQKVVWSRGFGYADKNNGVKAGSQTIYRAGSITKLFTATAVMQLAEQGLIDIDQPLQRYLPEFSIKRHFPEENPVTARLIMTHHSGLPSNLMNSMWGDDQADFRTVATQLNDDYLAFKPGEILSYSNVGFSLLGHLVEKVSGLSYAEYVEKNILKPVGMNQAYMGDLKKREIDSKGYLTLQQTDTPHLRDSPAGSLNANVIDLARFAQMTFASGVGHEGKVIQQETLKQMQSYQDGHSEFDLAPAFGLSWALSDRLGEEAGMMAAHDGGTPMFSSQLLTLPRHKLAVIVLGNSNTAAQAVPEIAHKALELVLQSKTGIKVAEPVIAEIEKPLLEIDWERLAGSWSSMAGVVDIEKDGKDLELEFSGINLDIRRKEDGRYYLGYDILGFISVDNDFLKKIGAEYHEIKGHQVLVAYLDNKPLMLVAEKIKKVALSDQWKNHLGNYESINSSGGLSIDSLELKYENGLMLAMMEIKSTPGSSDKKTVALKPVSNHQAVVHGLGRSMGDTLQFVSQGGEELLSYSGFLLKRVH